MDQLTNRPRKETIDSFLGAIAYAAMQHKEFLGIRPLEICEGLNDLSVDLLGPEYSALDVEKFLLKAYDLIGDALRSQGAPSESMSELCFHSSLTFQWLLLTRILRTAAYGRPVKRDAISVLQRELVLTWRHAPWFVHHVNDAMPELDI